MRTILRLSFWIGIFLICTAWQWSSIQAFTRTNTVNPAITPPPVFLPLVSWPASQTAAPVVITQPAIVPSTVVTAWLTYTDPSGITFEHPATWQLKNKEETPGEIVFYQPKNNGNSSSADNLVRVAVQKLPLAERDTVYPYNPKPIAGGWYFIYWATPITVTHASGLLYVSSRDEFDSADLRPRQWDQGAGLIAAYYNEAYELVVFVRTEFDNDGTVLAQHKGLTKTVAEHFPIFDHMVKSIRFFAPLAPGQ